MTSMENLPNDVLPNIFKRLLAKQIGQMRCVSKSWNALLSDSPFIKSHLNHSINNKVKILLFFNMEFCFDRHPLTSRRSRSPNLELTNFIKLPAMPKYEYGRGSVIGSVNGLICFTYSDYRDDYDVYIWNPSLSAILSLPPLFLPLGRLHFRFGYDPKTDDYKIVKLTRFSAERNKVERAEVYSMRKGSWKLISLQTFPSHIRIHPIRDNSNSCVNDHLHWLCVTDLESKPQTILGFDLGEDAFIEIPLPETILDSKVYRSFNVLGALGGKLCVMSRVGDGKWEVWVMEEYGVVESWVKHHVFSQLGGNIVPYGFTSQGDFLFQVGVNNDGFGLYDPIAANTKTFKIMSRSSSMMTFVEYVDSLVWIEPFKHEISSCDISQLKIGK